jgi:hypothetical protein
MIRGWCTLLVRNMIRGLVHMRTQLHTLLLRNMIRGWSYNLAYISDFMYNRGIVHVGRYVENKPMLYTWGDMLKTNLCQTELSHPLAHWRGLEFMIPE